MKEATKILIRDFEIKKYGFDFMGYKLQKGDIYTFHHLIVPKRKGGKCEPANGAVLCGATSHRYLHIIEGKDFEIFDAIRLQIIEMKLKGKYDIENLKKINDLLSYFEDEHSSDITCKGKILIKKEYIKRINFNK